MVGKTEITGSLRTADLWEAQERARLERVKLDGEWVALRRQLAPAHVDTLSDAEIWRPFAKWFVAAEKGNSLYENILADRRDAEIEGTDIWDWNTAAPGVYASAVKLLAEEGFCLDPTSPTFLRVQQILHRAMIEPNEGNSRVSLPATGLLPV